MATGGNLDIALRIKADLAGAKEQLQGIQSAVLGVGTSVNTSNTALARNNEQLDAMIALMQQAVASLQSMDAQMGKLSTASATVAKANTSVATSATEAAAATKALSETEAEATARRRAMIAASREQMLVNGGIAESERSLAERAGARIELSVAERAAIQANAEASRAKVAAEMEAIAAADGETVAVEANTAAQVENTVAKGLNARTTYSLSALISDAATGQFGRSRRELGALANETGLLSKLMSPAGVAIGATLGALGLFSAALIKGYLDEQKFNEALLATGNYAGVTSSSLQQLASNLGSSSGNFSQAHDAVLALAQSGHFAGAELGVAAEAAVNMAQLTGESIGKAVGQIVRLQEDPVRAVKALNDQYHFLTASTYEQIQALTDEGQQDQAAALAQQEFSDAMAARVQQDIANMAPLERAWRTLNTEIKTGLQLLLQAGSQSIAHQKDAYYEKRGEIQGTSFPNGYQYVDGKAFKGQQAALDYIDKQIAALNDLGEAQDANAKKQSDQAKENAAGIAAVDRLHTLAKGYNQIADKQLIVKQLNADLDKQWKTTATLPAGVNMAQGGGYDGQGYDYLLKKALGDRVKPTKPKSTVAAENAAERAQQDLIKLLGDEQGAIDPVTKVWAQYNDKVTKANELAAAAVKAKGANVTAIHAERDAVIAAAATARDAALAKIADKDRLAFEKLRDSLKDVNGVSLGRVAAQVAQLNADLAKGVITSGEYKSTLELALNQGVKKLPTYSGVSAVVGGPFGELDKLDAQEAKLQSAYKADLDLLNQQHDAKLRSDQSFVDRENALFQEHAQNLQAIDDARTRVMLAGITSSLSQGAAAIKAGFGQQSAAYRAAFALQKAAAIAMAIVNMQLDISQAAAKGWPANMPLIAQAIGEGLQIIGTIRGTSFATGGYTGPGGKYQPAGIVHAGEGVLSQEDIASLGGPAGFTALRAAIQGGALRMPGYADGGIVSALANAPQLPAPDTLRMAANASSLVVSPVSVVIENHGSDSVTAKQTTGSDGSQLLQVLVGAVASDMAAGGKTSRAMETRYQLTRKGNSYG